MEKKRRSDNSGATTCGIVSATSVASASEKPGITPTPNPPLRSTSTRTASDDKPKGWRFALIISSCWACIFLVSLDRTIVATAIPTITDDFHSSDDVLWYSGAYLITSCATQLLWGRVCTFYKIRYFCFFAVILFEIGSAVCGAAPNSITLIIGRAIAGMGAAAIFTGMTVVVVFIVPLRNRPVFAAFSSMFLGLASILGPLIGGAFTDSIGWRWCFWLNLPVGGAAVVPLVLLLKVGPPVQGNVSIWKQIRRLDPPGQLCLFPSVICLLLALQWGGIQYAWGSGRIVALLVLFVVLTIAFWVIQKYQKENATVRISIIGQRTVAAATTFATLIGGVNIVLIYWLAIWFQTVKGASALHSGINTLPLVISWPVTSLACGFLVTKFGYYQPPMYLSCILLSVGTGLMTTFSSGTSTAQWIGYQILFGCGLGLGTPQATVATQNSLSMADTPVGITLILFAQSLGGAVLNAIAQAVYEQRLQSGLETIAGIDPKAFVSMGSADLRQNVPGNALAEVLSAYNSALRDPFYVAVIACSLLILPTLAVEWKKLPPKPKSPQKHRSQDRSPSSVESDEIHLRAPSEPPSLALPDYEPFDPFNVGLRPPTPASIYSGPPSLSLPEYEPFDVDFRPQTPTSTYSGEVEVRRNRSRRFFPLEFV